MVGSFEGELLEMKRIVISFAALLAFLTLGSTSQRAEAQGFDFQTRRVHVDIGRAHENYGGGGSYWGGGYGNSYHSGYRSYGHSDWHEIRLTSITIPADINATTTTLTMRRSTMTFIRVAIGISGSIRRGRTRPAAPR